MTDSERDDEKQLSPALGAGVEFDLIRQLVGASPALGDEVLVGPGDDAAVMQAGQFAISTDVSIEDVHFRRSWISFEEVAYRAVAAASSDLAAMAARPVGMLLAVSVADGEAEAVVARLGSGVAEALQTLRMPLIGGDLTSSPGPVMLNVTVLGEVAQPVTRAGAVPGDEIWVTGSLGGSAGAVRAWRSGLEPTPALRTAFVRPTARIREALWLVEHGDVHAMIDLSDGLAGDVGHMAAASGVSIEIEPYRLPLHSDLAPADVGLALSGGEDYELCIASPPGVMAALAASFRDMFSVPLTLVGTVGPGAGVVILGQPPGESGEGGGFDHFTPRPREC